jgi:putative heme iron utilization protein
MANFNGRHATGGRSDSDVPEPSFAERVRTLLHVGRAASLATVSRKHPEYPFGSVMPYALDDRGRPVLLISSMAVHTQNLQSNPRASLLVMQPDWRGDPLAAARVTLLGDVSPAPQDARADLRELYLSRHANARYWVNFEDFAFYRMEIIDAYFVGGFGVMGWVAAEDYAAASPDPLADVAPQILEHVNTDHNEALLVLAKSMTGIDVEEARMTAIDRLGFHLRLKARERITGTRIAFPSEVSSADEARMALVKLVADARSGEQETNPR